MSCFHGNSGRANNIVSALEHIIASTHSDADIQVLRQALQAGDITVASAERAVAVGGDVNDSVIVTGSVVHIFKGPDAETIRQVFQHIASLVPPALLTHAEFSARVEQASLASHQGPLAGREAVIEQFRAQLAGPTRVILLHGPGGIGKTRVLLTLPGAVPEGTSIWYIRTEAESIEHDLTALDRNLQHVIVVDDAHRFAPLAHLREAVVNPELAGKVKVVLATRGVFKETVLYQLGSFPGDQICDIGLEALTNADIDLLLQNPPHEIADQALRHALVRIAEGSPLLAGIGARLAQRGVSIMGLTRDQVLTHYLDLIIHDLAEAGYDDRYIGYLQVLAALGTLDLGNEALREKVQQVVGISEFEEGLIVGRLVSAGLVERYWMTLKIASEVLADHILIHHFFDRKTRRTDYQRQIIEPFLALKPKEILTNLAEAEVKGESSEAGSLLGQKLEDLRRIVTRGDNIARWNVLHWLEDVAYLRPDDMLAIMAPIVDGPEQPPAASQDGWLRFEIAHKMVLDKAIDILSRTIYQGSLGDAITYLHKLAGYRPEANEYARVREKAHKALVDLAEWQLGEPYVVQHTLLETIAVWLELDFAGNLGLTLAILRSMLSMQFMSTGTDPTQPFNVYFQRGVLRPDESLRRIREDALDLLYKTYCRASSLSERLKIVQALDGAVPHIAPSFQVSAEMQAWSQPDCLNTARFFSEVVVPEAELPVVDVVAKWLWRARRFGGYQADELERLGQQIQNHSSYQLYRILVGWYRSDEEDDPSNWQVVEQRRGQAVERYLEELRPATMECAIRELDTIAEQACRAGESGTKWFNVLLRTLGEGYPDLARQLIERAVAEELALKHHLGFVMGGLRRGAPDMAWAYIEAWLTSDDPTLWLAVASSYRFADWSDLQTHEWDVLRHLAAKGAASVDFEVIGLTWRFAPHNPDLAIELLKILAARGDESTLRYIAMALTWPDDTPDGRAIKFANPQDYLDILHNFERLPSLDDRVQECLDRLGQVNPMQAIDFIEQRIGNTPERHARGDQYDAIPFELSHAFESIRSSPAHVDVLRRVRDWMLREDVWFRHEAPRVLKSLAGGLQTPLYGVLKEWVESDDVGKLKEVASILREFNVGGPFYALCREIICRTDEESILGSIKAALGSTPGGGVQGGMSHFHTQRLEEVSPWLRDENFRVRHFAERMRRSLQEQLECEQATEELERRQW
jgi:Effector-associated domain 10